MSSSPSSARWSSTPAVIVLLDEATVRSVGGELAPVVLVDDAVVAVDHDQLAPFRPCSSTYDWTIGDTAEKSYVRRRGGLCCCGRCCCRRCAVDTGAR
jgi:hypothetical protein